MEAVESGNFLGSEIEVEDACILREPLGVDRLGYNDEPLLERPAEQDLCVGSAMGGRNGGYLPVIDPVAGCQRCICFYLDPFFSAEREQRLLIEKGAEFDLVY